MNDDMQSFLDLLGVGGPFDPPSDMAAFRQAYAKTRAKLAGGSGSGMARKKVIIPTAWGRLVATIFRSDAPTSVLSPALVYFHGGGWTLGSAETHRPLLEYYTSNSDLVVIALDYALAPEVPFPGALIQGLTALSWLRGNADTLGIDGQRIAVGGDSAGANLAVAVCLAARDMGAPLPVAAMLAYGSFDSDPSRPSYREYDGDQYLLTAQKMAWFWNNYAPNPTVRTNPLAAPLRADLSVMPPIQLTIAGLDILRDENLVFAANAQKAGVSIDVVLIEDGVHGFMEAVGISATCRKAVDHQLAWINQVNGKVARSGGSVAQIG